MSNKPPQFPPTTPDALKRQKEAQRLTNFIQNLTFYQRLCLEAILADANKDEETKKSRNELLDKYEAELVVEYPDGSFWGIDREINEPNNWTYYSPYGAPMFGLSASQGSQTKKWYFTLHLQGGDIAIGSNYTISPDYIQNMMQNAVLRYKKQAN